MKFLCCRQSIFKEMNSDDKALLGGLQIGNCTVERSNTI